MSQTLAVSLAPPSHESVSQIRSLPLFENLPPAALNELAAEATRVYLAAGAQLFAEGDDADSMYVVVYGRLSVIVGNRVVDEPGRGELIGEMGIITGEPRAATVRASRDSILLRLSKAAFDRHVLRDAETLVSVTRQLLERMRRQTDLRAGPRRPAVVGVLAIGESVPAKEFSRRLAEALETIGRVGRVGTEEARSVLASPVGDQDERLTAWLSEKEERSDLLLIEADSASPPDWRARCVRQADTLLVLVEGDRGAPPSRSGFEELDRFERTGGRRELVLLHSSPDVQPKGADQWLEWLKPAAHHHIHLESQRHIDRLARFISGTSVTLVLGGGGARGFAHIGIYRALCEAGIPIDAVGGTSMGSVIAGEIARGWDPKAMIEATRSIFVTGKLYDPVPPVMSVVGGKTVGTKLKRVFGETQIEDLWTRFFCVTTNLTTAEAVVHERGPMWKWIKTSGTIPGIAPPVPMNGDLLVDGGLLDNLPVETGRRIGRGRVIASNVSPSVDRESFSAYPEDAGMTSLFWRRFRPWTRDRSIPTLFDIISRATSVGNVRDVERVRESIDMLFAPPVANFGMLDLKALDAIADAGYRYAAERLSGDHALPEVASA